jgi:hypothetical protein
MLTKGSFAFVAAGLLAGAIGMAAASWADAAPPVTVSPAVYRVSDDGENAATAEPVHWRGYRYGYGWRARPYYRPYYYGGIGAGVFGPRFVQPYPVYPVYPAPIYPAPVYRYPVYGYPAYGYAW